MRLESFHQLRQWQTELRNVDSRKKTVYICGGTGCRSGESDKLASQLREFAEQLSPGVEVKETGCHGLCEKGPLLVIRPSGVFYHKFESSDLQEIVEESLVKDKIIDRLLYHDPHSGEAVIYEKDIPFYKHQERRIFAQNGWINPYSLEDYLRSGGYESLVYTLENMTPEDVIGEVEKSGLRGRGGGGYPTGRKWRSCRKVTAERKYIVCNADEGDPGAYMDRSLLEGNPYSVLEGMLIGAWAIGAEEGYVYVREEYPLAVESISKAVEDAEKAGLLGDSILGSTLNFRLKVTRGGGAFICGESTALLKSLEGHRGEPRSKHVHTVEKGLYGYPTILNNVETWANIPHIIETGSDHYRSVGTEGSPGTKIFSLVGKVRNTGLIEVPMGMSLRNIIFDVGGGIPKDKSFKAVQTGGPSGGCIPEEHLDTPVDFDELKKLGSMMGSGGMIVMDEDTCMVEVARFYTKFLVDESCGKCTPCRDGLWQVQSLLSDICEGRGKPEDLEHLESLGSMIGDASLCALGKTAINPLLSTLRHFRHEYIEHIEEKKCRAAVCRGLFRHEIVSDLCIGCTACAGKCPNEAIAGEKKSPHSIIEDLCTRCGICIDVCPSGAIRKVS